MKFFANARNTAGPALLLAQRITGTAPIGEGLTVHDRNRYRMNT